MGGMVLETNTSEIITRIEEQAKLEKSEVSTPLYPYSLFWHYAVPYRVSAL